MKYEKHLKRLKRARGKGDPVKLNEEKQRMVKHFHRMMRKHPVDFKFKDYRRLTIFGRLYRLFFGKRHGKNEQRRLDLFTKYLTEFYVHLYTSVYSIPDFIHVGFELETGKVEVSYVGV